MNLLLCEPTKSIFLLTNIPTCMYKSSIYIFSTCYEEKTVDPELCGSRKYYIPPTHGFLVCTPHRLGNSNLVPYFILLLPTHSLPFGIFIDLWLGKYGYCLGQHISSLHSLIIIGSSRNKEGDGNENAMTELVWGMGLFLT